MQNYKSDHFGLDLPDRLEEEHTVAVKPCELNADALLVHFE